MLSAAIYKQGGNSDLRPLDIAKPGPFDLDPAVAPPRRISDFASNMLPLAVAVGPYDESGCASRLVFDVLGNVLVVLPSR